MQNPPGRRADSSMSKTKNKNSQKHFNIQRQTRQEAEIGPLIPFWRESTFIADELPLQSERFEPKRPVFNPENTKKQKEREEKAQRGAAGDRRGVKLKIKRQKRRTNGLRLQRRWRLKE